MLRKKLLSILIVVAILTTFMPSMTFAAGSASLKVKYTVSGSTVKMTWNKINKTNKYVVYSKLKGKTVKLSSIKSNKKRTYTVKKITKKTLTKLGVDTFNLYVKAINSKGKTIKKSSTATVHVVDNKITVEPGKNSTTNKPFVEEKEEEPEEKPEEKPVDNPEDKPEESQDTPSGDDPSPTPTPTPTPTPDTDDSFKAVFNQINGSLKLYYDTDNHSGSNIIVFDELTANAHNAKDWAYNSIRSQVRSVEIDSTVKNYTALKSTAYMFAGMKNADSISGAENIVTTNVTNMHSTFMSFGEDSETLQSAPDISGWNTSKVTDINYLFNLYGSKSKALDFHLDLSKWDISKVNAVDNDDDYVFWSCANVSHSCSVTIPVKTAGLSFDNDATHWYYNTSNIEYYIGTPKNTESTFLVGKNAKKSSLITLNDISGAQDNLFRVLYIDGSKARVMSMHDYEHVFNTTADSVQLASLIFGSNVDLKYYNSSLDKYLNGENSGDYFHSLPSVVKNNIDAVGNYQYMYSFLYNASADSTTCSTESTSDALFYDVDVKDADNPGDYIIPRKVDTLDFRDIADYLGEGNITEQNICRMFYDKDTVSTDKYIILRSGIINSLENILAISPNCKLCEYSYKGDKSVVRPVFTVDLNNVNWSVE